MKNWIPAKCVSGWKWSWWFLCVSLGIEVEQLWWICRERQQPIRLWSTIIHQRSSNTLTAHIEGFRPKSLNPFFPWLWLCFSNLEMTLFHIFLCESFHVLLINMCFSLQRLWLSSSSDSSVFDFRWLYTFYKFAEPLMPFNGFSCTKTHLCTGVFTLVIHQYQIGELKHCFTLVMGCHNNQTDNGWFPYFPRPVLTIKYWVFLSETDRQDEFFQCCLFPQVSNWLLPVELCSKSLLL